MLRIVTISDTHNSHDALKINECDILIHAGDESYRGTEAETVAFAKWFNVQPARHLVWTPGNHSLGVEEKWPKSIQWMMDYCPRANILLHSDVTLEGVKVWGSPATPWYHSWAYNFYRGPDIKAIWDKIPSDTNIVVTHGPPYGIRDVVERTHQSVGCEELRKRLLTMKPKYHVFGHIHEGYGQEQFMDTTYINASIMDREYDPVNAPIEFNY
jgi:Icc-related predicted phosphoesterase